MKPIDAFGESVDTPDLQLKKVIEALLFAADKPLTPERIAELLVDDFNLSKHKVKQVIAILVDEYQDRGVQLVEHVGAFRFQTDTDLTDWVQLLWEEKPQKYSRALLETLALIAYRQPITRGDIEEVRGVAVSSSIIKTLQERDWVRVVGHREVPGRPAIYATTKDFLRYFNLSSLEALPTLSEIRDIDLISSELMSQLEFDTSPEETTNTD